MQNVTRQLRVLLVEDDDDHADLLGRQLRAQKVVGGVDRVADGVEGLAYLRGEGAYAGQSRPDAVVLDLNMPRMNGHEFLAAVKNDPKLRMIPVIVLTTSDAESDRLRAYAQHANSYLVKPVAFGRFEALARDLSLYWGVWNQPGPPGPGGDR